MLCTKCGTEYVGSKCPKCSGPEILINNDDYLRRKKAYEEKQAHIKESTALKDEETADAASVKRENLKKLCLNLKNAAIKLMDSARKSVFRCFSKMNKYVLAGGIVLILFLCGIFAANINNKNIYFMDTDNIYKLSNGKVKFICEVKNTFFEAGGEKFYIPANLPEGVSDGTIISSQASSKGKYFASVIYNEADSNYSIMLWNDNSEIKVVDISQRADIMYVGADGTLVYKAVDVVNDEGAVGASSLYIYKPKKGSDNGSLMLIEENLKKAYVYTAKSVIIYITNENELNICDYNKDMQSELIAENVSEIYTHSGISQYSYKAADIYTGDVKGFIYNISGNCYYKSFEDKSSQDTYITRLSGTAAEFLYQKDNIYIAESNKLSIISDTENPKADLIDNIASLSDILYVNNGETIVYINDKQQLCCTNKGKTKILADKADTETLKKVSNSESGIIYETDGVKYCRLALNKAAFELNGVYKDNYISSLKKYIYYINGDGQLCSRKNGGSSEKALTEAQYYWIY